MRKTLLLSIIWVLSVYIPTFRTAVAAATMVAGDVVINEILASNNSVNVDPDFVQYSDWIEIYNFGNSLVDLSGFYLSDDPADPQKWAIPEGTEIAAGEYLIVWADGQDQVLDGLHTNFKLNNGGETVGLFDAGSTPIDVVDFARQVDDVSFGRSHVASDVWLFYEMPTPGSANSSTGLAADDRAGTIDISLASGFYSGSQPVSVVARPSATVRYTTDGSDPNRQSAVFTGSLTISQTTVFKARGYEPNLLPGPVVTKSYFINENRNLPVVSLVTDPDNLRDFETGIYVDENILDRKLWERPASLAFFDDKGQPGFKVRGNIRLFGRSAIYIPQKSLSFFPYNTIQYPIFEDIDVREFNAFLLRSSSDDWHLTMFRDAFIQTVIRKNTAVATQAYQPAVLFVNGEYFGIHNIREKYNEAYLANHFGADPKNVDILYIDERADDIEVLAGDREHYDALVDFVENHDMANQDNFDYVAENLEIENLIDYAAVEGIMGNSSWAHNIRAWRPKTEGGKWQFLVFDLDRGYRTLSFDAIDDMANRLTFFKDLLDNQNFRQRFIERCLEYLNGSFAPEKVTAILDSMHAGIAAEMPNHIARWDGHCGNNVCGISSMSNWEESVAEMRNVVEERTAVVLQQLQDTYNLNGTARLEIDLQQPGFGDVHLGELTTINQEYSGEFFRNMNISLVAHPNEGYEFVGWQAVASNTKTLFSRGSVWKYFDKGALPATDWNRPDFNDSGWDSGPAQLGYGDNDEATTLDYGPDRNNKYVTNYFRTTFEVADVSNLQNLLFKLVRDDGAVVYLNGQEVLRSNMPSGTINYSTWASTSVGGTNEDAFMEFSIEPDALVAGENCLAVEIHQDDPASSDIGFDLEIDGIWGETSQGNFLSEEPQFNLQLNGNQALTAVFEMKTQNVLPAEISENTVLTLAGSPYIANSDVRVLPNVSLTIEPGVQIQFAEGASLIINGALQANGTTDLPIRFVGIGLARWGALCLEDAPAVSSLSYAQFNGATTGPDAAHFKASISTYNSDITIDHITMENVGQPFYGYAGTIVITNSTMDGTGANDDMINIQHASATIENCHLFGNGELDYDFIDNGIVRNCWIETISTNSNRDGIDIGTSKNVLIENNRIFDCPDKGVSIGEASTATVRRNVIVNTSMGVAVKDNSVAEIDHNTFYDDGVGVNCYEKNAGQGGGTATVTNSIFAGKFTSETGIDDKSTVQVSYSISEKSLLAGEGNLQGNPKFVSVALNDFNLLPDSPCIDAGSPSSPQDPDGTRNDIGALFFNTGPVDVSNLFINEIMAGNSKTIADNAGQYDDWIEIYNGGTSPVNIAGLYLTDDFENPALWRIPTDKPDSTTIAPGKFLLLWADKDLNQGVRHVDLKLSASGEQLALVKKNSSGVIFVDSLTYSAQTDDISFGRIHDGNIVWKTFSLPTPGVSNDSGTTQTPGDSGNLPVAFAVHQNYPNPFNPRTTIIYELPEPAKVTINIYDSIGRRVTQLVHDEKTAGVYRVEWQGLDDKGLAASSGVYFFKVTAGNLTQVHKMVLLR